MQKVDTSHDPPRPARRVFARTYATDGVRAVAAAQCAVSAAVDQRRLATLRRIGDLQSSLASLVAASSRASSEEGVSVARQQRPSVSPSTCSSLPRLAQSASAGGSTGGAHFLVEAQQQVERLTRENHDLVRRCLKLEARIEATQPTGAAVASHVDAHNGLAEEAGIRSGSGSGEGDDLIGEGEDVEEVEDPLEDSGSIHSPQERPFFSRYGTDSASPQLQPPPPRGRLPEAIYGLLHRASVCYPELFDGLEPSAVSPAAMTTAVATTAAATNATSGGDRSDASLQYRAGAAEAVVVSLREDGVCEALWRLESVLPGLVSSSRLGDLFTDAGAALLDRLHILEDEKQADYFRVVEITERLMKANAALTAQDEERRVRVETLAAELAIAQAQRGQLVDQLAAERTAAQSAQRQHAAQLEAVEAQLEARRAELAAQAEALKAAEERCAVAEAALKDAQFHLAEAQQEREALEGKLAAERAAAEAVLEEALRTAAAERQALEEQLTAEVVTAKNASRCHRVGDSSVSGDDASGLFVSTAEGDDDADDPEGDGGGDTSVTCAAAASASSPPKASLRKLNQTLKRMTHERTALRRKLERQAALLTEAQAAAELATLQLRTVETELAAERSREAAGEGSANRCNRRRRPSRLVPMEVELLDFAQLEAAAEGGATATLYPTPLEAIPDQWLTTLHDEPVTCCVPVAPTADDAMRSDRSGVQLQLLAGGPLYHVGRRILAHAGLETEANAIAWSRLLLQLQHAVEQRGSAVFTSHRAADTAQLGYALLMHSGLVFHGSSAAQLQLRWALVVALLCASVGPVRAEETDEDTRREAAPMGEPRWRTVEQLLAHVTKVCTRDGVHSFFPVSAVAISSDETTSATETGEAFDEGEAKAVLCALLRCDDGPLDALYGCRLHQLVLRGCAVATARSSFRDHCGSRGGLGECVHAWTAPDAVVAGQLILRLSREVVFFRAPAALHKPEAPLRLYGHHVLRVLSNPNDVHEDGDEDASGLKRVAGRLLLYLDGAVLPLTLATAGVLAAVAGVATKEASHHGADLLQLLQRTRGSLVEVADSATAGDSLNTAHVDAIAALFAAATSCPAALEQELVGLYEENSEYRSHIEKLLAAIEAQSAMSGAH